MSSLVFCQGNHFKMVSEDVSSVASVAGMPVKINNFILVCIAYKIMCISAFNGIHSNLLSWFHFLFENSVYAGK